MSADILAETIDLIRRELGTRLDTIVIERAVIGVQSGSGYEEGRPLDQSW